MQRTDDDHLDRELARDFPLGMAAIPASAAQRRTAIGVVIVLGAIAAAIAPFADIPLPKIDAFVPVLQTVLAVADLMTALLLFAQYPVLQQRALLAAASAYLCSASFAFLQTLSFPGSYAPAGLMGDGFNTPAWFFVLWHATFPLGIIAYTLLKDGGQPAIQPGRSSATTIGLTVLCVSGAVAVLAWFVTTRAEMLPAFYAGSFIRQTNLGNQVNVALLLWYATALVVLLARARTILDIWLLVILIAWMPNFLVAALASSVRFSLGWYAARGFALVASFILLSILLTEMIVLYSRLANAFSLLRRERANRLMSIDAATGAIAHEIRGPLGAIALNANTALAQLRSKPPALQELAAIMKDIESDAMRANDVLSGVRALFKARTANPTPATVQQIALHALALSAPDLLRSQVSVTTDFADDQVPVHTDPVQLQQVLLNLIRNALEAMASIPPDARRLMLSTKVTNDSTVLLSIHDTGGGIPDEERNRIFDAFFTTKRSGMGLGLAISRAIVESHGGTLRLADSGPQGSIFELALQRAD
ncbi:MASE4 domain-containing protein [Bradyrhizobium cajani]|uniref:histidine kinase n=1 Tax=Bradyrhizobium cajani TaxID=1928661 RepID=A0A844T4B1_9BRAD|nr:MASE4 domain-containing protein [Bradyrhizobium cajani]MCP3370006.1 MASE4 domain-containing protein [Bradyrhizobium cajani]MVT73963.1 GHKL domain-containing protein [Bradyrhizobium cajani]